MAVNFFFEYRSRPVVLTPLGCIPLRKQNFSGTIAFKASKLEGVCICQGGMFLRLHWHV